MTSSATALKPGLILPIKKDPVQEFVDRIQETLKDEDWIDLFYGQVLVAKWIRTTLGNGSILASRETQLEDSYQGKVGLVLKVGPGAFKDDSTISFHGADVKPGDWVIYRNNDGTDFDYVPTKGERVNLRYLEDAQIKGKIKSPLNVW